MNSQSKDNQNLSLELVHIDRMLFTLFANSSRHYELPPLWNKLHTGKFKMKDSNRAQHCNNIGSRQLRLKP